MTSLASKLPAMLLLTPTVIGLTACGMSSGATDSYCLIAKPITYSSQDTAETVKQIETHNSDWACKCRSDCE